jgi:hypothetical protein
MTREKDVPLNNKHDAGFVLGTRMQERSDPSFSVSSVATFCFLSQECLA